MTDRLEEILLGSLMVLIWCLMVISFIVVASDVEAVTIEEAVYFESGNQGISGKIMVAWVILNRVESPLFPNTEKEVIEQTEPSCQFSFFCDGKPDKIPDNDEERAAFEESKLAVLIARNLRGAGIIYFPALFYKADYSKATWNKQLIIIDGNHQFYR